MDPKEYKSELEKQIHQMQQNIYEAKDNCEAFRTKLKDVEIAIENYQKQVSWGEFTLKNILHVNLIALHKNYLKKNWNTDTRYKIGIYMSYLKYVLIFILYLVFRIILLVS